MRAKIELEINDRMLKGRKPDDVSCVVYFYDNANYSLIERGKSTLLWRTYSCPLEIEENDRIHQE